MAHSKDLKPLLQGVQKKDFSIVTLDDEILADQRCLDLLRHFNQHLTCLSGLSPEQAGELCRGADYFLREFVIADRHDNLFNLTAERIRQFAGHWYILRSLEPNLTELQGILRGTRHFYAFLADQDLVDALTAHEIARQCGETDYYRTRIEDFWAIEGDGFDAWRQACPLEPVPDIS